MSIGELGATPPVGFLDFTCAIKQLAPELRIAAAVHAVEINPANEFNREALKLHPELSHLHPYSLAALRTKRWAIGTVIPVAFVDNPSSVVRRKILECANLWPGHLRFVESSLSEAFVRVARTPGDGYYSYLGPDCKFIPSPDKTMNLDSFSEATPDSEYVRVVCHEFGHARGYVHEMLRKEIVGRLDRAAVITWGLRTQGWSEAESVQQMLTPVADADIVGGPADESSIMCYPFGASLTLDHKPIVGGMKINDKDAAVDLQIYPQATGPTPPDPNPNPNPPPIVKPPGLTPTATIAPKGSSRATPIPLDASGVGDFRIAKPGTFTLAVTVPGPAGSDLGAPLVIDDQRNATIEVVTDDSDSIFRP